LVLRPQAEAVGRAGDDRPEVAGGAEAAGAEQAGGRPAVHGGAYLVDRPGVDRHDGAPSVALLQPPLLCISLPRAPAPSERRTAYCDTITLVIVRIRAITVRINAQGKPGFGSSSIVGPPGVGSGASPLHPRQEG